jgi:hypothetical protein
MLYRMIYSSKAVGSMNSTDLEQILVDARTGNEARNVTGALVYVDGVFLQILEGEREVLKSLLESIRADTRHESMKVFHEAEIPERSFSDWRMGYLSPDVADMSRWTGLEGTETIDALLDHVHRDAEHVPKILVRILEAVAVQRSRGNDSGARGQLH